MKTLRFLMLGLLLLTGVCRGQITDPGWYLTDNSQMPVYQSRNGSPLNTGGQSYAQTVPIAETNTPDIQALARNLQNDPLRIFNYVHDHIKFVLYFGSKKGAELTYLEKSGNDFDQSALLVALLRAAGYSPSYEFGVMKMPYDQTNHNDLHHWLQLSLVNSNWTNTGAYFQNLLGARGYPFIFSYGDGTNLGWVRVWVVLTVGTTTYNLDPAFKVSEPHHRTDQPCGVVRI